MYFQICGQRLPAPKFETSRRREVRAETTSRRRDIAASARAAQAIEQCDIALGIGCHYCSESGQRLYGELPRSRDAFAALSAVRQRASSTRTSLDYALPRYRDWRDAGGVGEWKPLRISSRTPAYADAPIECR